MRTKICIVLVLLLTAGLLSKEAGEKKIQGFLGLDFAFNQTDVKVGDNNIKNSLLNSYPIVTLGVRFHDYLVLGVMAGFNHYYFKQPVDFTALPLSMGLDKKKFNALVLGLQAKVNFFSQQKTSLSANGEILYFKSTSQDLTIQLPIVTGTAELENSFYQVALELVMQYQFFRHLAFFVGPQLNLLKGEFKINEKIENVTGNEILNYQQKNLPGLTTGFKFQTSRFLDVILKLSLFSKTSLVLGINYIF